MSGLLLVSTAAADQWDKKTSITFSAPVEIPGQVLPAGTYVFKLMDTISNRDIVQILDTREDHVYATILAVPDFRLEPTGKTVIQFEERAHGAPGAIKAWFYPGENYGEQLVYPHVRALQLASQTNQTVLATHAEVTQPVNPAPAASAQPSVNAMRHAEVHAVQPSGEQIPLAQAVTPRPVPAQEPVTVASNTTPAAPERLPQSGSEIPLIALIGACALGGATLAAFIRQRMRWRV